MEVKIVGLEDGFKNLESDWVRLTEINPELSVFQSWEWQRSWWKYYGNSQALKIVVAYYDGQVVGILPLYIQRRKLMRFFNIEVMRFIGTGGDTSPDYLGVLSDPEHTEIVCQNFSNYIISCARQWDVIALTDIVDNDIFLKCLDKTSKYRNFKLGLKIHATIRYIDLPETWLEYMATRSKNQRKHFRNIRNGFEKMDGYKFFVWDDNLNLNSVIDRLIELHHMRWEGRDKKHSFQSSNYTNFHREVIKKLNKRDAIRLYCMEVEGKIIAIEYCYKWRNKIFSFQCGFDPLFEKKSPGTTIITYVIENAIEEGNEIFDMLKGDHSYKRSFSNNKRGTSQITIYQKNRLGWLYQLRYKYISNAKNFVFRLDNTDN